MFFCCAVAAMAYMRGERLCGDARGDFGRCCRTRALLLDAIRAGQVVLEDVRAARLAGLRMGAARLHLCVFAPAFLRADGSRAANRGDAWFRGPRISGRDAQRFHACAASPPVRTRRLTFLKAGRGHTTSSSSAITIAKMDQRSCSITYQPRNCVDVLPLSCASRLDKDGKLASALQDASA